MKPGPELQPTPPKRVSLRDIAEMAGVHLTTVSAVLSPRASNRTRVSEETASRIQKLAAQLKYRPSFHAQVMRKRRTGLIGLIEFGRSEISSTQTLDLLRAIRSSDYYALTTNVLWYDNTSEGSGVSAAIDYIVGARVEGVVLVHPTAYLSPSSIYEIQEAGIPCVAFNGVHFPEVPQVRSDMAQGVEELTRHLLNMGRRRLVLVGTWSTASKDENACWTVLEKITGFKMALLSHGGQFVENVRKLESATKDCALGTTLIGPPRKDFYSDAQEGYNAVLPLLKPPRAKLPDALICSNDRYAQGALRACFEAGIKVPEQIAIVGFGGEQDTRYLCPALTTVDTLSPRNADTAVELLLEMIRQERPIKEGVVLKKKGQLLVRESCGFS